MPLPLKTPLLPLVIVMSSAAKPITASEKVKVKVIVSVAVPDTSSLIVRVGAWVSKVSDGVVPAPPLLPAASV